MSVLKLLKIFGVLIWWVFSKQLAVQTFFFAIEKKPKSNTITRQSKRSSVKAKKKNNRKWKQCLCVRVGGGEKKSIWLESWDSLQVLVSYCSDIIFVFILWLYCIFLLNLAIKKREKTEFIIFGMTWMNIAEKAKRERRSKYVILDKYLHWRMKTGSVPTSFSSVRVNVFFWHVFPQYWSRIHCPLCVSVSIENVFSLLFLEIPENEMKNVCCFFSLVCSLFSSSIARKYYQYSTYENKTHTFCKNMWRWWHYGTQQSIVSIDCYHILFWFWFLLPIMDLFVIIFFTSTFFYATNGVFSAAPIRRSEVYSFNLKCCDTQL